MFIVNLLFDNKVKTVNEFDEILDLSIRKKEQIEEDVYQKLKGNFFKVITSQNGSRVLQKALQNTETSILVRIFEEIKENVHQIMIDSYGNYFCQRFFSYLNKENRIIFLKHVNI